MGNCGSNQENRGREERRDENKDRWSENARVERKRGGGGERDRAKQKLYIETTKTREKKEDMFISVRR